MSRKRKRAAHQPMRLVLSTLSVLVLAALSISPPSAADANDDDANIQPTAAETYAAIVSIINSAENPSEDLDSLHGARAYSTPDLAPSEDDPLASKTTDHLTDESGEKSVEPEHGVNDGIVLGVDENFVGSVEHDASIMTGEASASFASAPMTPAFDEWPNGAATDTPPVFGAAETPLLDVAMDAELQHRIFTEVCSNDTMRFCLMMAIAEQESKFDPTLIGDGGNSYGIVQINRRWHLNRIAELGVTDLLDPVQCMHVGLDYIEEIMTNLEISEPTHRLLMAYNMGPSGARDAYANGTYSSTYSRGVMERYEQFMAELTN